MRPPLSRYFAARSHAFLICSRDCPRLLRGEIFQFLTQAIDFVRMVLGDEVLVRVMDFRGARRGGNLQNVVPPREGVSRRSAYI